MEGLLTGIPFDPALVEGARNAVEVCLRVRCGEKVTLIADEASLEIGAASVQRAA